ncbi:type II toxin-antitoxin system HicB family antitoxin [Corynebacterium sp. MSK158]|uniref:type II toxin-antitoxin system HicB family antitoxin n=1 Tax=Corynebacterium sp. MSK158 TaxID=3050212 RepID=UPI00254B9DBD|nr:type II toxin-antitoxin system HicB family antitoxin [Corynebacterium sp. MSK158]MDK8693217.1 type II toxin-antitoxin system HicB family antitoxin [Corynebacterium sp. MSK158]
MATVAEFPSLSWLDSDRSCVEQELLKLVAEVVEDTQVSGEVIPQPLGARSYSGKFNVRTSPSLHRKLVMEARAGGISLNALINQKFVFA